MAHVRTAKLICDACCDEVAIDPSIDSPFASPLGVRESNYGNWGEVRGKHLCPSCFAEYKRMCADHEVAIHDRFGI